MRIKLIYDGPYGSMRWGGRYEVVVSSSESLSDLTIRNRLYPEYMGLSFDERDSSYEIME